MLAGELYDPFDPELVRARDRARDLCQDLNATREAQREERRRILRELFGAGGEDVWMQPPFYCDYGSNIRLGERVFFNFNCVVLDVCEVRIGDFVDAAENRDQKRLTEAGKNQLVSFLTNEIARIAKNEAMVGPLSSSAPRA